MQYEDQRVWTQGSDRRAAHQRPVSKKHGAESGMNGWGHGSSTVSGTRAHKPWGRRNRTSACRAAAPNLTNKHFRGAVIPSSGFQPVLWGHALPGQAIASFHWLTQLPGWSFSPPCQAVRVMNPFLDLRWHLFPGFPQGPQLTHPDKLLNEGSFTPKSTRPPKAC